MTYLREPDPERYRNITIDLPRFAADLANELEAKLLPAGEYPLEEQKIAWAGDELVLHAHHHKRPPVVSVEIVASDVPWDRRPSDPKHQTERALVNPEKRSIKAIAADVKRRVIERSQPALHEQRKYVEEQNARVTGVAKAAKELQDAFPDLRVEHRDGNDTATVYMGGDHYVSGRVAPYGVTIDRIGSMSLEKFKAVLRVLKE